MPLGIARAGVLRKKAIPFELVPAFTPASTGSTVSTLVSNTLTFETGDLLVVIYGGSNTSTRTGNAPTGNWTSPPTFVVQFQESVIEASLSSHIGLSIATADSNQTTEDVTQTWSSTLFPPVVGFFRIPGGASVRQISSLGTKLAGSTTLTCTFSAAPRATSLVVALMHGRSSTLFGSAPTDWTSIFSDSPSTNSRTGLSNRLNAPTSQIFSGFNSAATASGRMIEFVR